MIYLLRSLAAAATLAAAVSAQAQSATPALKVRGTIAQVGVHTLTLRQAEDGRPVTLVVPANAAIRSVSRASLADIKPDSFIGTAATQRSDGTLKALEVHIFAPSLRGSGEGFRPWRSAGGVAGTMTNGTVGYMTNGSMVNGTVGATAAGQGARMSMVVKYQGGQQTVAVSPDVPVVYLAPGKRSLLKRGVAVLVFATRGAKGVLIARSVIAGQGGIAPPM
ncbi:hypothetical protein [Bordetella sp. FB-8]|uniref:hypothetical protein n=1 Tax=Bordetella sp. FB-8 TaxID=1159870 RepID=UPI000372B2FC|nr:hypothetical protein [Bordetella sp. FB-8]